MEADAGRTSAAWSSGRCRAGRHDGANSRRLWPCSAARAGRRDQGDAENHSASVLPDAPGGPFRHRDPSSAQWSGVHQSGATPVSKSLHSGIELGNGSVQSGCPRSLQVATFQRLTGPGLEVVWLPPQSPSRYIRRGLAPRLPSGLVAPAVSKSLHSAGAFVPRGMLSGCPRSLQVATFPLLPPPRRHDVWLPPQSPSRYIQAERNSLFGLYFLPPAED